MKNFTSYLIVVSNVSKALVVGTLTKRGRITGVASRAGESRG
jgi:hypothetical protein